jgi:hypothetical protein
MTKSQIETDKHLHHSVINLGSVDHASRIVDSLELGIADTIDRLLKS